MAEYVLTIRVDGVDQTAPAVQGMERLGASGVAAGTILASALQAAASAVTGFVGASISAAGDYVYNVRDRAAGMGDGFTGNTWEHPRVIAYGEAIETLRKWVKEPEEEQG